MKRFFAEEVTTYTWANPRNRRDLSIR